MSALVSGVVSVLRGPWVLSSGAVEALKWLAFAVMLVDHVNTVMYGRQVQWMFEVGRVAMPVFAVVFGYNLARSREPWAAFRRLLLVGLAVQPLAILTINRGEWWPMNVLLTFVVGAGLVLAYRHRRPSIFAALLLLSLATDYPVIGALLVFAACQYATERRRIELWGLAALAVLFCVLQGTWAPLAGFALVLLATRWKVAVPHWRWAFLALYPAHLLVLAILADVR